MYSSFVYSEVVVVALEICNLRLVLKWGKELYVRPHLNQIYFYNISAEAELSNSFICTIFKNIFINALTITICFHIFILHWSFRKQNLKYSSQVTQTMGDWERQKILSFNLSLSSCSKCKKQCIFFSEDENLYKHGHVFHYHRLLLSLLTSFPFLPRADGKELESSYGILMSSCCRWWLGFRALLNPLTCTWK